MAQRLKSELANPKARGSNPTVGKFLVNSKNISTYPRTMTPPELEREPPIELIRYINLK